MARRPVLPLSCPPDIHEAAMRAIRRLPRPLSISFSGGRTSGLMLRLFIDAFDGELPDDVVCLFANTGKEAPETLDFVQECSSRWSVPTVWLEYDPASEDSGGFRIVSHNSASREGEPFAALIGKRNMLPNPVTRFCTEVLKIRPMARYCRDAMGWENWHVAVGIRADEPRRVARIRACGGETRDRHTRVIPLADAGVTRNHVRAFWQENEFDLHLPMTPQGTTPSGNCDLCFLKSASTIAGLIREKPERAQWWIEQEARLSNVKGVGCDRFRMDRPSYVVITDSVERQGDISEYWDLEGMDCACTD